MQTYHGADPERIETTASRKKDIELPTKIVEMSERLQDCGVLGKEIANLFIAMYAAGVEFSMSSDEEIDSIIHNTYASVINIQVLIELLSQQKIGKEKRRETNRTAQQIKVHLKAIQIYVYRIRSQSFRYDAIQKYCERTSVIINSMDKRNKLSNIHFYKRMGHLD